MKQRTRGVFFIRKQRGRQVTGKIATNQSQDCILKKKTMKQWTAYNLEA